MLLSRHEAAESLPGAKGSSQVPGASPRTAETAPATSYAPFPAVAVLRPLPVAKSSELHEWTAGDCRDPEVLERIAHTPEEFERLLNEGARVLDRQLVYRKDTIAAQLQRVRLGGPALTHITLPSLHGEELQVELTGHDLEPSFLRGSLHGRLVGRPSSMVTLAFKAGREAFTVLSPEDGLYLQADPREPGELLVKRIDPETYVVGSCGTE